MRHVAMLALFVGAISFAGEPDVERREARPTTPTTGVGACTTCHLELGQVAIRRVDYVVPADTPRMIASPMVYRMMSEMMMRRTTRGLHCRRAAPPSALVTVGRR